MNSSIPPGSLSLRKELVQSDRRCERRCDRDLGQEDFAPDPARIRHVKARPSQRLYKDRARSRELLDRSPALLLPTLATAITPPVPKPYPASAVHVSSRRLLAQFPTALVVPIPALCRVVAELDSSRERFSQEGRAEVLERRIARPARRHPYDKGSARTARMTDPIEIASRSGSVGWFSSHVNVAPAMPDDAAIHDAAPHLRLRLARSSANTRPRTNGNST